jgi:hypothetical protein
MHKFFPTGGGGGICRLVDAQVFFLLPGEHQQLFAFGVNKNKSFLGPFASLLF